MIENACKSVRSARDHEREDGEDGGNGRGTPGIKNSREQIHLSSPGERSAGPSYPSSHLGSPAAILFHVCLPVLVCPRRCGRRDRRIDSQTVACLSLSLSLSLSTCIRARSSRSRPPLSPSLPLSPLYLCLFFSLSSLDVRDKKAAAAAS